MDGDKTAPRSPRPPLADRLRAGLLETLAFAKGDGEVMVTTMTVPDGDIAVTSASPAGGREDTPGVLLTATAEQV